MALMNNEEDRGQIFFHVDIDAFYASVEQIDNPKYRGKPVIVGALPGKRGVVSTCSYEARKFGVKSAMPISRAYKLCPHAIYLPVRMKRYLEISRRVMNILRNFTPQLQQISIDEAFLDMTGTEKLFGTPIECATKIKERIKNETGLTISVGIAHNKYLAKLASDYDKPDGLYMVKKEKAEEFVEQLALRDLWGIGNKTLEKLHAMKIDSVKKLKKTPKIILSHAFGKTEADYLHKAARGIDPGIHPTKKKTHSISSETTFQHDTTETEEINRILLELSTEIIYRLIREEKKSKTVAIKIRYSDFTTHTVQKSLKHWITSSEELYKTAKELFNSKWQQGKPIRLLGVGLYNVENRNSEIQTELFDDNYTKKRKIEETVVRLKEKDSKIKITRASFLLKTKKQK